MDAPYIRLGINLALSAVLMFLVMYAMIDGVGDFYLNIDMAYMALMMVAPMGVLMLLIMPHMYQSLRANLILYAGFTLLFLGAYAATRSQALVGDEQFLRAMIPHHSGAILMCREAAITDPEIVALCGRIQRSQREEIDQMKAILARY
ncbi:MAG TPA: DUF305 domain-containing protein [Allosphingosinicella sp.]|nr:DUF305 domain-containing protein [Allosphingosinicella sp.]